MEQLIKYLENIINECDSLGGFEKEKWAFNECLKEAKKQALILPVVVKSLPTEEEIISEIRDKHNKMVDKQIEDYLNAPATGNKLTGFFNK